MPIIVLLTMEVKQMNETIKTQLNHRTIRNFHQESVSQEIQEQILAVINRTATSNGLQTFSIIRVTDAEKRAALAKICKQAYVQTVPEFWLFVVDNYRNAQIAKAKGYQGDNYRLIDYFFQGVADSQLAAQNAAMAIESLGLGAVYFGSILNDLQAVVDLFELPELTVPILGLGFGQVNDHPQLKPRMPIGMKVGENAYPYFTQEILTALEAYDQEMQTYYDTRFNNQRVDAFTTQVHKKFESSLLKRSDILKVVRNQGFDLHLD